MVGYGGERESEREEGLVVEELELLNEVFCLFPDGELVGRLSWTLGRPWVDVSFVGLADTTVVLDVVGLAGRLL